MYVCPDCKTPLENWRCPVCDCTYEVRDGIPILLPHDPTLKASVEIAAAYDSIYERQTSVWENQGRTTHFFEYFASLLERFPQSRFLELGCGEGFLLRRLHHGEKFATDLSIEALRRARLTSSAQLSVALVERLPFPSGYFDLVTSVGVMEHFLDIDVAMAEICRVLRPSGYYVALTHVDLTVSERLRQKVSEYIFPQPRPLLLLRWLGSRLKPTAKLELVKQPIQHRYTVRKARAHLERHPLRVVEVLHKRRYPRAPLTPEATIYIAQRRDGP